MKAIDILKTLGGILICLLPILIIGFIWTKSHELLFMKLLFSDIILVAAILLISKAHEPKKE